MKHCELEKKMFKASAKKIHNVVELNIYFLYKKTPLENGFRTIYRKWVNEYTSITYINFL